MSDEQYWRMKEKLINLKPNEDRTLKGTAKKDAGDGSGYVVTVITGAYIEMEVWDIFGDVVTKWHKTTGEGEGEGGISIIDDGANGRYNVLFADTDVVDEDIGDYTYRIKLTVSGLEKIMIGGKLTVGY